VFSIHGTGVSSGIVIARARVIATRSGDIPRYHVEPTQIAHEIAKLQRAIVTVQAELSSLKCTGRGKCIAAGAFHDFG
jgi:phosphoenolpyruvate-protein kinase (PTS system EI component)